MELSFTRTGKRTYMAIATRDDGVVLRVPGLGNPTWLPHDIAHYVVEQTLRLKQGFWGSVAAGAIFHGMTVISGRQPPHAAARSQQVIQEMGQDGTEAEVLVGILVGIAEQGLDPLGPIARARVADAWRYPRDPAPEPIPPDDIQQICVALHVAKQQWDGLAIGQSITVSWPYHRSRKHVAARVS